MTSNGQFYFIFHHLPQFILGTPSIEPPYLILPPKKRDQVVSCHHDRPESCGFTYRKTPQKEGLKQDSNLSSLPPNKFSKSTFQEGLYKMIILLVGGELNGGYITNPEAIHNFRKSLKTRSTWFDPQHGSFKTPSHLSQRRHLIKYMKTCSKFGHIETAMKSGQTEYSNISPT